MNSYFITKDGVAYICQELTELSENLGMDDIYKLCPDAVANEIVGDAHFDEDMQRNGHFVHELGMRSPRGHVLTITVDRTHCEVLNID